MAKRARTGKLGLGVLGAGNIADMNVAGYLEHPDCDVLAVCDVDGALRGRGRHTVGGAPVVHRHRRAPRR